MMKHATHITRNRTMYLMEGNASPFPLQRCGGQKMTPVFIDREWFVCDGKKKRIAGPFDSNARAWRWIDQRNHEPHNRNEAAHDWSAMQILKSPAPPAD